MIKTALREGQECLVINIDHSSDSLGFILSKIGVRCIFIDCEQGNQDFEQVERIARVAKLSGASSVVRLWSCEPWLIERMILRGVDGIVVPRVESAASVTQVVAAVKYVAQERADDIAVIVQIECKEAVEDLDQILRVPGVDCFFIGPVDLSKSYGFAGKITPEIREKCNELISVIRASGRTAGILVNETNIDEYRSLGVKFLYFHANDLLRVGLKSFH